MDEQLRKPYQGQLVKFTNVVKGWQARWFVLNPENGTLHYFLSSSEFPSRVRGSIQLAGAVISPSDEDSLTFTVSPAAGEAYKLRAQDTKDRQMWLNRLRMIAEMHTRAIAHHHPPLAPREHRVPGSSSTGASSSIGAQMVSSSSSTVPQVGGVGVQSGSGGSIRGLAVLDAFTQVSELLQEAHRQHASLASTVEDLPSFGKGMKCYDANLLLLKATSQATVTCLDNCLSVLKSQQHTSVHQPIHQLQSRSSKIPSLSPLLGRSPRKLRRRTSFDATSFNFHRRSSPSTTRRHSPTLRASSPSLRTRTAPHSPIPSHYPLESRELSGSGIHSPLAQTTSLNSPSRMSARTSSSQSLSIKNPACELAAQNEMVRSTPNLEQKCDDTTLEPAEVTVETPAQIITSSQVKGSDQTEGQNTPTLPTMSGVTVMGSSLPGPSCSDSEESDSESEVTRRGSGEDAEGEHQTQHSVIMHIISQLRLGMDLTRVTLPTFILEKRSLLEMFADFIGHPDYFLKIADCRSSKERLLAVMRWYLTSVHVGRKGASAKKPYNPVIGETFQCGWRVPIKNKSSEGSSKDYVTIKFAAEQVSHHPPVSAFYFECPEKQLCINAHIWTKSKFMGMSVGVNLVGDITLVVGNCQNESSTVSSSTVSPDGSAADSDSIYVNCTSGSEDSLDRSKGSVETYSLSMPSAYARSILTEPWAELGGRVNIHCVESRWSAPIVFHTKPFYGGCLHRITGEVKDPMGSVVARVNGEWDGVMEISHQHGDMEIVNVKSLPLVCEKRVRPVRKQREGESRRLWQDVTSALSRHDLDTATAHKRRLEEMQRAFETSRKARGEKFTGRLFQCDPNSSSEEGLLHWTYRRLPPYVTHPCISGENTCS